MKAVIEGEKVKNKSLTHLTHRISLMITLVFIFMSD